MSYFITSGIITLRLDTEIDISTATVKKILYKKPSGVTGGWDAIADGNTLTYDLTNTDIDITGVWQFQTYVEIGGEKGFGEIVEQVFMKPLN